MRPRDFVKYSRIAFTEPLQNHPRLKHRHSGASRNPECREENVFLTWTPAFVGVTNLIFAVCVRTCSSRLQLNDSLLLQLERRRVNTVAQTRWRRPIWKHMPEMRATLLADHFGAAHAVADIAFLGNVLGI